MLAAADTRIVALRRIVLEKMSEHLGRGQVVDSDDLIAGSAEHLTESQSADTTEAVDSYLNVFGCHFIGFLHKLIFVGFFTSCIV